MSWEMETTVHSFVPKMISLPGVYDSLAPHSPVTEHPFLKNLFCGSSNGPKNIVTP